MESKTKILAYTFLAIAGFIFLLTKGSQLITSENSPLIYFILNKIRVITYMLASSLLIWRGIYFIRKKGYQHKCLAELILGLFLAIAMISALYMTSEFGSKTLEIIVSDTQSLDHKIQEQILQIKENIAIIERGIIMWIGLTVFTVLLGLFWPIVRSSNKSEEPIKNPRAAF